MGHPSPPFMGEYGRRPGGGRAEHGTHSAHRLRPATSTTLRMVPFPIRMGRINNHPALVLAMYWSITVSKTFNGMAPFKRAASWNWRMSNLEPS